MTDRQYLEFIKRNYKLLLETSSVKGDNKNFANFTELENEAFDALEKAIGALEMLKNALTIEKIDYPTTEDPANDIDSYFIKTLYKITQRQMSEDIRENLKEWVVNNFFRKEQDALEILRNYIYISRPFGTACYLGLNDEQESITEEEYGKLEEVL